MTRILPSEVISEDRVLGAFGVAGMWEAVFADVGVALIAVCNAMRILRNQ